jgi:predicted dehydrogenase
MQWAFWLNDTASNAEWKLDPATGGPNAFYDAGNHLVDLMLHLLPQPEAVTALSSKVRFSKVEDNVSALLRCGPTLVELHTSQSMRSPSNALTLDFAGGTVFADHAFGEQAFSQIRISTPESVTHQSFDLVNPYAEEIASFIRLLDGGASTLTTVKEARNVLVVLESITKAANRRSSVALRSDRHGNLLET